VAAPPPVNFEAIYQQRTDGSRQTGGAENSEGSGPNDARNRFFLCGRYYWLAGSRSSRRLENFSARGSDFSGNGHADVRRSIGEARQEETVRRKAAMTPFGSRVVTLDVPWGGKVARGIQGGAISHLGGVKKKKGALRDRRRSFVTGHRSPDGETRRPQRRGQGSAGISRRKRTFRARHVRGGPGGRGLGTTKVAVTPTAKSATSRSGHVWGASDFFFFFPGIERRGRVIL